MAASDGEPVYPGATMGGSNVPPSGPTNRLHAGVRRAMSSLSRDEAGFTLMETIIAITVIFGSLLALAYTATIGFKYEDLARQKQTATGIANQMMEQVRGLAWDKITAGHLGTDLGATRSGLTVTQPDNGYLVTGCVGDAAGVYRLLSCAAGSQPGSGEKLVASAVACPAGTPDCVSPLVRHAGQITQNNIVYTWRVYDTNSCPTSGTSGCTGVSPYRVTVVVTWTGGGAAPNKIVQTQSLFWSPSGCRSTATHPFAAPCQPFFFGSSLAHASTVDITGSISGTTFQSGNLTTPAVQSAVQQEQLSQARGSFSQSTIALVDDTGTQTDGGASAASTAADTDPGTLSNAWSRVRCPTDVTCPGGSLSSGNVITITAPSGETAESDSTTSASSGNVCPPPTDTAQTDGKSCSGARIQQGGTLSATLSLNPVVGSLGTLTLAQILAVANTPNKTLVDRVQNATTGLCAPVVNSDGCLEETGSRAVGTLNVGGLASGLTAPIGWTGPLAWNGAYFSIVGYQDSVSAAAGTNSTATQTGANVPPPTASVSGTLYCWNGLAGYNVGTPTLGVTCGTLALPDQTIGGHTVGVTISGSVNPAQISKSPTSSAANVTDASAQVTGPTATIHYVIVVDGNVAQPAVDLTIVVNLNALEASGSYALAPSKGS